MKPAHLFLITFACIMSVTVLSRAAQGDRAKLRSQIVYCKKQVTALADFVPSAENSSTKISMLRRINGKRIYNLEEWMRPGYQSRTYIGSTVGFLGKTESLLKVLIDDNEVVKGLGLSHQLLAEPLKLAVEASSRIPFREQNLFQFHSVTYSVVVQRYLRNQYSPFQDGVGVNGDYVVTEISTGKKLNFAGLLPELIGRYGFYEGKELGREVDKKTYRISPESIAEFFHLID